MKKAVFLIIFFILVTFLCITTVASAADDTEPEDITGGYLLQIDPEEITLKVGEHAHINVTILPIHPTEPFCGAVKPA